MTEEAKAPPVQAEITAELVASYVSRNSVPVGELPALIRSVYETLSHLGTAPIVKVAAEPLKPAVPIKKSITADYLISLEDGRKLKSMKRYLSTLGMTPADYRAKWGLPADYPMSAPNYTAQRSALARSLGLGRKTAPVPVPAAPAPQPAPTAEAPKRGRKATKKSQALAA